MEKGRVRTRGGKVATGLPAARRLGVLGGSPRGGLVELTGITPGGSLDLMTAASTHPFLTPYT